MDAFDEAWRMPELAFGDPPRWRPPTWGEAIDPLFGRISADDLTTLAQEALAVAGHDHDAWTQFLHLLDPDTHPSPPTRDLSEITPRSVSASDEALGQIAARDYIEALTGRTPSPRLVQCPFHKDGQERTPSLDANGTDWYCHGCGEGGGIFQFAAKLWGLSTRGSDFLELKRRLTKEFGG